MASGLDNNASSIIAASPSDTPGAVFVIFQPIPTFKLYGAALERGQLELFYVRASGGADVPVKIDLRTQSTDNAGKWHFSDKTITEAYGCLTKLVEDLPRQ